MNRVFVSVVGLLAVIVATSLAALSWGGSESAFACSGPSTIQQMALAPAVFSGRITAVEDRLLPDIIA